MPCRGRAAALDTIWITDDVLTDAFNRFARVSHTHTCRRYGSNVPGPLEAHRRLARRRMGIAVGSNAGPPPPDWGALFGLGTRPPAEWERSWKWEAPSWGPAPPPPAAPSGIQQWAVFPPTQCGDAESNVQEEVSAVDPIRESAIEFQRLLDSLHHVQEVGTDEMEVLVSFLQSSADELKAKNMGTLCQWLESRSTTQGSLMALAEALRDKAQLGTLDDEQILRPWLLLLRRGQSAGISARLAETLDAVPSDAGKCRLLDRTSKAICPIASAEPSSPSLTSAHALFSVLDISEYMKRLPCTHDAWRNVYRSVAAHIKPAQLDLHFANLNNLRMAKVLLHYWTPHYAGAEDAPSPPLDRRTHRVFRIARRKHATVDCRLLIKEWQSLQAKTVASGDHHSRSNRTLINPVLALARQNLPYPQFLADLFDLLMATRSRECVWRVYQELRRHPELGVPENLAVDIVHYFMSLRNDGDAANLRHAWQVFHDVPSMSVQRCLDLPLRLIEHGYGAPHRIFCMLNRQIGKDNVAPEFRKVRRLALRPEHVDLAHLVAYAWASQDRVSSRTALRRVWETYRFLQDRGAPIGVLMSRSLVKAGISRPLTETKGVALAQSKYIISLVHRLEGGDVAKALDRLVFAVAKKQLDFAGTEPPAEKDLGAKQSDEAIVRATRWRLRRWTRMNCVGRRRAPSTPR